MNISNIGISLGESQDCKFILDKNTHKIIDYTASTVSLYGYKNDSLMGLLFTKLCPNFNHLKHNHELHFTWDGNQFTADTYCFEINVNKQNLLLIMVKPLDESVSILSFEEDLVTLVSGFAHELNTPTGNVILATSSQSRFINQISTAVKTNNLTKKYLCNTLEKIELSQELIESSTSRISELVERVKRISISKVLESRSNFNLYDNAQHIFKKFTIPFKTQNISYTFNCDKGLIIDHDSTAFIQIIEELIENGCQHAFKEKASGQITLTIQQQNNHIIIDYIDNGNGMDQQGLEKLFVPFYTTSRDQGLVGLGMNMVFNLVSLRLKGTIKSTSGVRNGCHLTINYPLLESDDLYINNNNITEF
ncbi:MAG: signal transduction histidine kinase [Alteromonadaceae bacterium]|jgi:signal transduction histidine kinase